MRETNTSTEDATKPHDPHDHRTCVVPDDNAQEKKTKSMENDRACQVVHACQPVRRIEPSTILLLLTNWNALVATLLNWSFHRSMEAPATRFPPSFNAKLLHEDPSTHGNGWKGQFLGPTTTEVQVVAHLRCMGRPARTPEYIGGRAVRKLAVHWARLKVGCSFDCCQWFALANNA